MIVNQETKAKQCGVRDATPNLATVIASEHINSQTRMDFLTSLRAECLANLRQHSDRCAELLTNAGFGLTPSESCASYDPDSESLRTRQASLFSKAGEPGTELCQDFARSGMIVGGMYFQLPRLVQGISAKESSSSLPTLTAADGARGPDYAKANRSGSGADDLVTHLAKMLPTPRANPQESRRTTTCPTVAEGKHGNCVTAAVSAMLPTVRAGKHTNETEESWSARNEAGKVATPPLILAVQRLLPTPAARDWKDTPGMALEVVDKGDVMRTRDDQLPRRIYADESVTSATASRGGMRLTPAFLCWLMGYPQNWLKPLQDAPAMQSSRKSSSPSSKQSKA